MPRSSAIAVENSFVKGLITEATGLNFPENACTETSNCVFQHTGEVSRRLGIDYENDFTLTSVGIEGNSIREFLWKAVAQNGEFTFVVTQVGKILFFFSVDGGAISTAFKPFTVDLDTFKVNGSPTINDVTCSFDSGHGYLFVTHPYCEPFYVTYDGNTDTINAIAIDVRIRDFEGVEDSLEDDERPATLTNYHHYNLLNQGWGVDVALTANNYGWTQGSPLQWWKSSPIFARGDFPSNADNWWAYKTIMRPLLDNNGNVLFPSPVEAFSMVEAQNVDITGNGKTARGHYIFTAWNIDRASVTYSTTDNQTSLIGIPVISSGYQRPSQVTFYASRVWYAGVDASLFNTKIYFSKIIERVSDFGRCYQMNDPTTEKNSDLLPSDGGFIVIPTISKIIKMQQVGSALYIFTTNGVWSIEGGAGGFTAIDYMVRKVSPIGAISDTSFVDVDGQPMWWNNDGIWTVQTDGNGARVETLTFSTIQTFIDGISNTNKKYVKGVYNPLEREVQWLYRTTEPTSVKERYQYDGILNLSLVTQSFFPWSVDNSSSKIIGILVVQGVSSATDSENVFNNVGDTVTTSLGNVTADVTSNAGIQTIFKYFTLTSASQMTFSEFSNNSYIDWSKSASEKDFISYFVTGYKVHGDAIKKFQSNYTQIYTRNEVFSVFDFQSRWDFAISGDTGRWSNLQRITMDNSNYGFRTKRIKNRGHGKVLQYKVNSVATQPFNIIGWSNWETGNASA